MAKKSKKPIKRTKKQILKINPKNQKKVNKKAKIIKNKKKKIAKKRNNLQRERERIFEELEEDDFEDLFYGNDINNMPHDIFDTYEVPLTEKENKEYIKRLIQDSDVILYILDARDVLYFLDKTFEKNLDNNKLLIYIINKIDLVSEEYLLKISSYLNKEVNKKAPKLFCSCLIREKIQELYNNIFIEILNYKNNGNNMKSPRKRNILYKIGIVGMPNVGKNSLIQSFELLENSSCDKKYILFERNNVFCVNSVPGVIYDNNNKDEHLISKRYKKIKDLPDNNNLINDIFNYIEPKKIKDIYELSKKPDNIKELLNEIKKKFGIKNDKLAKQKLLDDIVNGKISYELNY